MQDLWIHVHLCTQYIYERLIFLFSIIYRFTCYWWDYTIKIQNFGYICKPPNRDTNTSATFSPNDKPTFKQFKELNQPSRIGQSTISFQIIGLEINDSSLINDQEQAIWYTSIESFITEGSRRKRIKTTEKTTEQIFTQNQKIADRDKYTEKKEKYSDKK